MLSDSELNVWIRSLAMRLATLCEWPQRSHQAGRAITALAPEDASLIFSRALANAFQNKRRPSTLVCESLSGFVLMGLWPRTHFVHTREAAAAFGDLLTLCFLVEPVFEPDDEEDLKLPPYSAERPLTLGERRSLARQPSRRIIELAVNDPHPMVAINLLNNPKVVEADVITMAARRPAASSVLAQIAVHPRWRRRNRVVAALCNNKYLHPSISVTLLPLLDHKTVSLVAQDARLNDEIRQAAAALLAGGKKHAPVSG